MKNLANDRGLTAISTPKTNHYHHDLEHYQDELEQARRHRKMLERLINQYAGTATLAR